MRFPFPPAETAEAAAEPETMSAEPSPGELLVETTVPITSDHGGNVEVLAQQEVVEEATPALSSPAAQPEEEVAPRSAPLPRPPSRRKVIAFPRQVPEAPVVSHRLADPVIPDQPRILDVPEELEAYPATPLLDGLQFAPWAQQAPAASADHIELPFQAVGLSQRVYAGVIDCALVAVAAALFGAVSYKMLPKLLLTKPLAIAAGAVPILLWAAYQYIFTVYGGATAGMRVARLRLRTFKGSQPNRRHRRSRIIGLYFSTASLLMGLCWGMVDVDGLCWHDRISKTYLTNRE